MPGALLWDAQAAVRRIENDMGSGRGADDGKRRSNVSRGN
jgi:hypothetical protein